MASASASSSSCAAPPALCALRAHGCTAQYVCRRALGCEWGVGVACASYFVSNKYTRYMYNDDPLLTHLPWAAVAVSAAAGPARAATASACHPPPPLRCHTQAACQTWGGLRGRGDHGHESNRTPRSHCRGAAACDSASAGEEPTPSCVVVTTHPPLRAVLALGFVALQQGAGATRVVPTHTRGEEGAHRSIRATVPPAASRDPLSPVSVCSAYHGRVSGSMPLRK